MLRTYQRGFTLIEIAIVLVIIGLLLGGVLKGQELITSARVRNLIAQQDGIKAAFFGFQDRFRSMPGDYASASTTLKCPSGTTCLNGNGNGIIEAAAAGTGVEAHEEILTWMHLSSAGFLNGSYQMTTGEAAPTETNSPRNPYNVFLEFVHDNDYYDTAAPPIVKLNLKTGSQIPVEIVAEVDRKIDDGHAQRGSFRFSPYNGTGTDLPAPAGATSGACVNSGNQTWFISEGQANCGGTSLF
ncbi:MAG: prepilin-type N-terminal cleavage/methylation domain-containing protein [Betaproteobacteria bacterium]|nr:prepilin-type N-terminal cleavage/methylation domain-containing protein [Betaproteobacteria bacterium]